MKAMSLKHLRESCGSTQQAVAASMRISQPAVSKLESGRDVSVAQLRAYIAALGGELVISARFGTSLTPLDVAELRYGERAPTRRAAERSPAWGEATSARVVAEPVVAPEWLDEVDRIRMLTPAARLQELANGAAFFAAARRRG
ncbi:MAG: hypothetical protein C0503_09445 [Gemmatimonas sp.]|nr:hypothetical protein [Gemmatimonas sp.]